MCARCGCEPQQTIQELFTAASLSGDQHMLDVLKTPGRDMHTSIAAKSFGYRMYDDTGKEITEDDVVELVRTQYDGDAENKEFKAWQKHTYFVNGHGEKLTFSQFKSGPRISGKNKLLFLQGATPVE